MTMNLHSHDTKNKKITIMEAQPKEQSSGVTL